MRPRLHCQDYLLANMQAVGKSLEESKIRAYEHALKFLFMREQDPGFNGLSVLDLVRIDAADRQNIDAAFGPCLDQREKRWSRKFGPGVKVDRMTKETIRNGKEKDAYA